MDEPDLQWLTVVSGLDKSENMSVRFWEADSCFVGFPLETGRGAHRYECRVIHAVRGTRFPSPALVSENTVLRSSHSIRGQITPNLGLIVVLRPRRSGEDSSIGGRPIRREETPPHWRRVDQLHREVQRHHGSTSGEAERGGFPSRPDSVQSTGAIGSAIF